MVQFVSATTDIDIADRLLPTQETPSGIPCTMHTTQIGLRFRIEQPEFITLSHGNPKTDKNHDENLQIAKVFERIGAFYCENETLSTIMYKDENFHVAMIEVVNIGYGVNPHVGFASMTDIAQPADGSVCISDNGNNNGCCYRTVSSNLRKLLLWTRILGDKIICDLDKTPEFSQRSPQNCPKCGHPVNGHYCQGCALLRKKFKEDLFTSGIEHGILQDSSEPSNDNPNVVNAPREPFNNTDDRYLVGHERLPLGLCLGLSFLPTRIRICRFAAGGNGHDGRDPRDVEIERLRQRVHELEINPFDRYERLYEDTLTDTTVEEYENEEIPEFKGRLCPNDFLDWLRTVDRIFDLRDTPDHIKVKLVAIRLKKYASLWLALKVEKQLSAKQKTTTRFGSSSHTPQSATGPVRVGPIKAYPPALTDISPTPTTSSLYCFKCQEIGHLKRDSPNKQVLTLIDEADPLYDAEDEVETAVVYPDRGELLVTHRLLNTIVLDQDDDTTWLRTNIFVLSAQLRNHPDPYQLTWLKKGNLIKVTHRCPVHFSIGNKYKDELWCEVIPMDACHILLGRPWLYDRRVKHYGYRNTYTFKKDSVSITLAALNPKDAPPDRMLISKTDFVGLVKVREQIIKHNLQYQTRANTHHKQVLYEEGDLVWIHLRRARFPQRRFGKLHPRADGPFRILKKINDNAYKVELPGHYGVSNTFNVADLSPYTPNANFDYDSSFVSCSFGWPENNTDDRYLVSHERLPLGKEKQIEEEQAANARYWKISACYDDDDDDYAFAITPNKPVNSISMGDEHLDTIPATESDEFIKSSVENLVPNPSESKGENECDVPAYEEFTTFSNILFDSDYDFYSSDEQSFSDEDLPKEIYSNPLFDEEIIPIKIDPHHFNAESDLIESLRNHDSSIIISSKIDSFFDEFAGELTLLKSIPSGIDETDCDPEKETHFIKRLLYDKSSPRPPKEFVSKNSNAEIESFSPSPIPVKDSDSLMEEIDLSFTPDYPMSSGIEDDDYESERDILISKELLSNDSLSLLENKSFHFDIPSSFRPPAKPPDGNTRILNVKMMGDISEQKVPMLRLMITLIPNQEKSSDLLSHLGLEAFQPSADISGNVKTLAKRFCTQVFIFSASYWESFEMSRDVLTVGSTMRIPLLYRGEYSQWFERFMNYLKEQTDGEAMINSIKNDKSMWSDQEKRVQKIDCLERSLLIQGLPNDIYSLIDSNKTAKDLWDALARHMLGSEYGEQDRKAAVLYESVVIQKIIIKNLMDINIDALYNILKQNQRDVYDAMGSKKKTVVVTSDPLALIAEKTNV
nr:hypothetical protein [Tanacetum cinerariifolium]